MEHLLSGDLQEKAYNIRVYGLVQGVGFRPFVYGLATSLKLSGWALNSSDGVRIRVQGVSRAVEEFFRQLQEHAPPLAKIDAVEFTEVPLEGFSEFTILSSQSSSSNITQVSPDTAVCQDCLADMKRQPHRLNYPFINCTNCGPRFSIIEDLPYDRSKTTMKAFTLCSQCQHEYEDVANRRFHAQPNACRHCGPEYSLIYQGQQVTDFETILTRACELLETGRILAMKGIGGFHLACDALNEEAVMTLRQRKQREGKPFAVMVKNLETLKAYTETSAKEAELLSSPKRPIVLLKKRKDLAAAVTGGLDTLGVMLPYTPFHYLLFERLSIEAIVLTSGNISDEPIILSNEEALAKFAQIADATLMYNRDIYNRCDDSVAAVVNGIPRVLRRTRGWVPEPITLAFDVEGIVAAGAELKTCFAVGKGRQAILSQHIGDLKNLETYQFYQEAFDRFTRLFRVAPQLIACDLHPDYLSTRFAKASGLPIVPVQHHHAHIAACMAEHGLDKRVIGISFDGAGLGDDGHIWGGEFLVCDLSEYTRIAHFDYIPMPGGDKAVEEPWRMAAAYLHKVFGSAMCHYPLPLFSKISMEKIHLLCRAIEKGINWPLTSSVGRLFDAIAALIDLVYMSSFEAEAPMRLEAILKPTTERYTYRIINERILVESMICEVVQDLRDNLAQGTISAKFHHTIAAIVLELAERIRTEHGMNTVVLSGGVFQNRYLLEQVEKQLTVKNFDVYSHQNIPSNDGGLCLGQLVVAAKRSQR